MREYTGERAAALAGVPKSTVYYWARTKLLVPSVSPSREKLWSYADLIALRIIYWLRQKKQGGALGIPATPMAQVRRALDELSRQGIDIWSRTETGGISPLRIDSAGTLHIERAALTYDTKGQIVKGDWLDLLGPFHSDGLKGPDLIAPRPHLRIIPGKLAGQPHVVDSRLSTLAIAALANRGFGSERIHALYPTQTLQEIKEAIDLEEQLASNLTVAA